MTRQKRSRGHTYTIAAHDLPYATITTLAELIRGREVSPVELCTSILARIDALEPSLHAFITIDRDGALDSAKKAEREIGKGRYRGPLHGIPVAHKDVLLTRGLRTTAHSKLLADFVPSRSATVVTRLERAGAITIGKANTHEFAIGGMESFGYARNPWNTNYVSGGTSSGSAVAVAAHMTIAATGSDTGGSIRIPAAFCGVVGVKATYGLVSRSGLIPLSSHMDHVGTLTKSVADAALMLNVIAGHDPSDSGSVKRRQTDYTSALRSDLGGVVLGVLAPESLVGCAPEVLAALYRAVAVLKDLGAELREVEIPQLREAIALANVIVFAEAASVLDREFSEQYEHLTRLTRRRLALGKMFTAVEYLRALRFREMFRHKVQAVFGSIGALVIPTAASTAYPVTDDAVGSTRARRMSGLTRIASLTGQPSASIPCGFADPGLPIGLQIVGRHWDERLVLRVAHSFENATPFHTARPPI